MLDVVARRLIAECEARFWVIYRVHDRLPERPEDEVEYDVAEAIAALRAERQNQS